MAGPAPALDRRPTRTVGGDTAGAARHRTRVGADGAFFLALMGVAAWRLDVHPFWRDELQSWQLAHTSRSLGELLSRVRYEQHPPLWYFALWLISRVTGDPIALKVLTLALVGLVALTVMRLSPFARGTRWLLLLGYFPFFEFGVLSRPYVASFLLALLGAHLIRSRRFGFGLASVLVGLLLLDDAYGLAVVLALLAAVLVRCPSWWKRTPLTLGVLTAEATALALGRTPGDYGGPKPNFSGLANPLTAVVHALLPTPEMQTGFWNTWAVDRFNSALVAALGLGVLVSVAWLVRRDRASLLSWCVGSCVTVLVLALTDQSAARFAGTFFVLFVVVCWLHQGVSREGRGAVGRALLVVTVLSLPGSLVATVETVAHPFSEAAAAAAVVRKLPGTVVAAPDEVAVPVAVLANRSLYFAVPGRWGTFTAWDLARDCAGGPCGEAREQAAGLAAGRRAVRTGPTFLLLNLNPPLWSGWGVYLRKPIRGKCPVVGEDAGI